MHLIEQSAEADRIKKAVCDDGGNEVLGGLVKKYQNDAENGERQNMRGTHVHKPKKNRTSPKSSFAKAALPDRGVNNSAKNNFFNKRNNENDQNALTSQIPF